MPLVAQVARELLNKSDNERSGVLSTAMSFLALYRDPAIAHVTGSSDWRIADLMHARHPVSLYLVVPPSDLSRTRPLVRLLLNQIGRRLTERLEGENRRHPHHRLLMMLDEFPALGRLDFFESTLAFMAGYGMQAFLVAQSLNQISKAYGEHNAILDNCHVRIAFATNDDRTAATGQRHGGSGHGGALPAELRRAPAGAVAQTESRFPSRRNARPLLTPGEVMQLGPDEHAGVRRRLSAHPGSEASLFSRTVRSAAAACRRRHPAPAISLRDAGTTGATWLSQPWRRRPRAGMLPPAPTRSEQRLFQDAGAIPDARGAAPVNPSKTVRVPADLGSQLGREGRRAAAFTQTALVEAALRSFLTPGGGRPSGRGADPTP